MASRSSIEWTNTTWNPVVGCRKVSAGCAHCYAEKMAARQAGMARHHPGGVVRDHYLAVMKGGRWNGRVELVPEVLDAPARWRQPRLVFANSMSDLFHDDVPVDYIKQVFEVMHRNARHTYQVLTKRSQRLRELAPQLTWSPSIWQGVSVESVSNAERINHLRDVDAPIRFLSLEPLLGPLPNLDLRGMAWVIVGGESGPGARPVNADWVRDIRDQCTSQDVPFFFKQWGRLMNNPDPSDPTAKKNGGEVKGGQQLDGHVWVQMPTIST